MQGRTKRFFLHDPRIIWWVINNNRVDEVAGFVKNGLGKSDGKALVLNLGQKILHSVVLWFVLDWSHVRIFISIHLERLSVGNHLVAKLRVDAFMDVDALNGDANLPNCQNSW